MILLDVKNKIQTKTPQIKSAGFLFNKLVNPTNFLILCALRTYYQRRGALSITQTVSRVGEVQKNTMPSVQRDILCKDFAAVCKSPISTVLTHSSLSTAAKGLKRAMSHYRKRLLF